MPQPKPTSNWKQIILAGSERPEDLIIPQNDKPPKNSESVLESMYSSEHWEWELWRHPDGHAYYLKLWPFNEGKFGKRNTPSVELTTLASDFVAE